MHLRRRRFPARKSDSRFIHRKQLLHTIPLGGPDATLQLLARLNATKTQSEEEIPMSMKTKQCKSASCAGSACKCGCHDAKTTGPTKGCNCGGQCNCSPTCNCKVG